MYTHESMLSDTLLREHFESI